MKLIFPSALMKNFSLRWNVLCWNAEQTLQTQLFPKASEQPRLLCRRTSRALCIWDHTHPAKQGAISTPSPHSSCQPGGNHCIPQMNF